MAPSPIGKSSGRWIVSRLGANAAARLGLDPTRDADRGRWLVAVCLRTARADEEAMAAAFRALAACGLETPDAAARAGADAVARALARVRHPQPERTAARLVRAAAALRAEYGGSMARLHAQAEGLDDLGGRIARLAPGIGAATVAAYLRPLRGVWPATDDLPLARPAVAAAAHLGWLEADDPEGDPAPLRAALAREGDAPAFADVEAALVRLGERACLRNRVGRCPLGDACPKRAG